MLLEACSIIRREHGYAGANFVGITRSGKIELASCLDKLPRVDSTRVALDTYPVKDAATAPYKVYIDPTRVCPLNCDHCLASAPTLRRSGRRIPSLSPSQINVISIK